MNISISGRQIASKKFSAVVSPGTGISFGVPIKTVTLMPVGGDIFVKGENDADADGFLLTDGTTLSMDLSPRYANDTSTLGIIFTASGTVSVYAIAGV